MDTSPADVKPCGATVGRNEFVDNTIQRGATSSLRFRFNY